MTTGWREVVACPRCGSPVSTEAPIKAWIRGHNDLDSRAACLCIGDSDLWVQRYGTRDWHTGVDRSVQYLMLVEIKTHDRELDPAQRDLLLMVNDLLRTKAWKDQRDVLGAFVTGHRQNARTVFSRISRGRVQVHCHGVHLLQLSGKTPDDSKRIRWDNKNITHDQLARLLRFDLQPDTLKVNDHRSHKRRRPDIQTSLWDAG